MKSLIATVIARTGCKADEITVKELAGGFGWYEISKVMSVVDLLLIANIKIATWNMTSEDKLLWRFSMMLLHHLVCFSVSRSSDVFLSLIFLL